MILTTLLAADPVGPGDHTRTLDHDGRTRTYIVHVPPTYDPKQPTPVVLAFHGGGSNAEQMVRFCGLNEKADKEGFIVPGQVHPEHLGQRSDVGILPEASAEAMSPNAAAIRDVLYVVERDTAVFETAILLADICCLLRDEHFGDELHPKGRDAKIIAEAVFQVLPKE